MMKTLFQKLILISGASLASILAFASPGNSSVFYDLEFFDETGELVGTGEFSHEDEPFDETIELCLVETSCGSIPLEIQKEDNFFRLESFFSTIEDLEPLSSLVENQTTELFWRPFDDELVASVFPCRNRDCGGRELLFSDDSWFDGIGRSEVTQISRMTATEWNTVFRGSLIPPEAEREAQGTWTATRLTSIPEPASTLGLMAMSAWVVGSKLKRKNH